MLADRIDEISNGIEALDRTDVLWITGAESFDEFEISTDFRRIFPYSPATGVLHPAAPEVTLEARGDEIHGTVVFAEIHNGPPFGYTHGGVISMVYDELLAAAAIAADKGGFTGKLTVNYRKLTPVLKSVELRSRVSERAGRKFIVTGEMVLNGEVLSEAEALFISPREGFEEQARERQAQLHDIADPVGT